MYRVHIHLTTGERLRSFKALEFDVDLNQQSETGLRKFTYPGPDNEEENIYLNPKGVAAIELRPVKEDTKGKTQEPAEKELAGSRNDRGIQGFERKPSRSKKKSPLEDSSEKPGKGPWRPPINPDPEAPGASPD